jgi:hypothetical protein
MSIGRGAARIKRLGSGQAGNGDAHCIALVFTMTRQPEPLSDYNKAT